jgi:hypothetical protein
LRAADAVSTMSLNGAWEGRMDGLAAKLAKEAGLGTAETAQRANDLNGLDPREVVELRFFLKPEELDEAAAIRKVTNNTAKNKTLTRA